MHKITGDHPRTGGWIKSLILKGISLLQTQDVKDRSSPRCSFEIDQIQGRESGAPMCDKCKAKSWDQLTDGDSATKSSRERPEDFIRIPPWNQN